MIKILLVDDHNLVRAGIKELLKNVNGIKVVGEAPNGEFALEHAKKLQPDIVLMDVKMPGIGGLETIRRFSHFYSKIKIIALTGCVSEPIPSKTLQAGAIGYVSKACSFENVVEAIRTVYTGQRYLSSDIAQVIAMEHVMHPEVSLLNGLSGREMQIMMMIAGGQKVSEISKSLYLSSKTVNSYRYRLFEKLKIKNDVELTHFALQHKLCDKTMDVG